jgi:hypothetical protein
LGESDKQARASGMRRKLSRKGDRSIGFIERGVVIIIGFIF